MSERALSLTTLGKTTRSSPAGSCGWLEHAHAFPAAEFARWPHGIKQWNSNSSPEAPGAPGTSSSSAESCGHPAAAAVSHPCPPTQARQLHPINSRPKGCPMPHFKPDRCTAVIDSARCSVVLCCHFCLSNYITSCSKPLPTSSPPCWVPSRCCPCPCPCWAVPVVRGRPGTPGTPPGTPPPGMPPAAAAAPPGCAPANWQWRHCRDRGSLSRVLLACMSPRTCVCITYFGVSTTWRARIFAVIRSHELCKTWQPVKPGNNPIL